MFLRPQHFQQHDRWIESSIEQRISGLALHGWGLRRIEIDPDALKVGQFRISAIEAVFPDGTAYSAPACEPLPAARQITEAAQGKRIYLALPLKTGGSETADPETGNGRYRKTTVAVADSAGTDRPAAEIVVATLDARIVVEGESLDGLVCVPIAEIEKISAQGPVALSGTFIPPSLVCAASPRLVAMVAELRRLLNSRAQALAAATAGQAGMAPSAMLELATLGLVSRYEAIFNHIAAGAMHPPEACYRELIALVAELSVYATAERRPPELPPYRHGDLRSTFEPVLDMLRRLLNTSVARPAVNVPLAERDFGIWLGEIDDRITFKGQRFVLVAQANVPLERIRAQMPLQIKIGPVEQIRDLVNHQLPGIAIEPLAVAPRELPSVQNAVCFQLDGNNPLWTSLKSSPAFALHVSGDYPGLHLELWAIQKEH
jgi:type VI secretion system protein ImpJ